MRKSLSLFALLLAAWLPTQRLHAQLLPEAQPQELDRIVAVVEDDVILQSDLDQAVQTVLQQFSGNQQQLPPKDVLRRQVLERLILQKLQVQRAKDNGVRVSDSDVDDAVSNVAQHNHMTNQQLRAAMQNDGLSWEAFRRQLADQLIVQRLRENVIRSSVQVSDSEIDNLLNSPAFKAGEAHLAHIVIGLPNGAAPDDIAKAQAKAEQVEQSLKDGMDFSAAAIRYSDATDALEGGDLGWRRMTEVPSLFANLVTQMQPGDVSPPIRGADGFQIIKLVERRQAQQQLVTEYHARHIMVQPDELVSSEQAQQKVADLRKRIVEGHEDFATVARKNSDDDTTANAGGDMGWFPVDAWGSAVATQLQQLKDGEISQPFHTQGGWHIIKRLGTRTEDKTDEVKRQEARQQIESRKAEEVYNNFLHELRSSAYVDIRLNDNGDKSSETAKSAGMP